MSFRRIFVKILMALIFLIAINSLAR